MTAIRWNRRTWFAEDVAAAMEALNEGAPLWVVAHAFGTTTEILGGVLSRARKHGFAAYPPRSRADWLRLRRPPSVSGVDAGRFVESLRMTA